MLDGPYVCMASTILLYKDSRMAIPPIADALNCDGNRMHNCTVIRTQTSTPNLICHGLPGHLKRLYCVATAFMQVVASPCILMA